MKLLRVKKNNRGAALITALVLTSLLAVAGVSYVNMATQNIRTASRRQKEIQTLNLADAGVQQCLLNLWLPFQENQNYDSFDPSCQGASVSAPMAAITGTIPGAGNFATGVISWSDPDSYDRVVIVRSVGWLDLNNDGTLDPGDPTKTIDVTVEYTLQRSPVFDYTYFINNYGWMDGFQPDQLIVNGDMRANGDFNFTDGSATVNGSVYAAQNLLLVPQSQGIVNTPPVKWTNTTYEANENTQTSDYAINESRWRPVYDQNIYGAQGSSNYEAWAPLLFNSTGQLDTTSNSITGAVIGDSAGINSWQLPTEGGTATESLITQNPTQQIIMPDLNDLSYYQNLSATYTDTLTTYNDGTPNPHAGQGAYLETWDPATQSYHTISTNGNISGSAILTGSQANPIIIHGPVTVSQDVLIQGYVSGQGTLYAGRNVHIIGSVIYSDPPVFQGPDQQALENANQKADLLGLAARGSAMMGDTTQYGYPYPLYYMEPPFTLGRYDANGNWIPPFNATETDSTGRMLYQSVVPDNILHALAQPVNQMDCIIYTNFVGGGDIGTGGDGLYFNGSIISKNEAMVVWSLPMRENYDNRIKEMSLTKQPLIDIDLPRSPEVVQSTWQDRGFSWGG